MATIVFVADGWGSHYGGINSFNYDLCLNTGEMTYEQCTDIIKNYLKVKYGIEK